MLPLMDDKILVLKDEVQVSHCVPNCVSCLCTQYSFYGMYVCGCMRA